MNNIRIKSTFDETLFMLLECAPKYDVTHMNLFSKIKSLNEFSQTHDQSELFYRTRKFQDANLS